MPDRAAGTALVLGSHSGEKYHLAGMGDRDDLREQPFRPLAVIVVFLFETRGACARRLCLRGQYRGNQQCRANCSYASHRSPPACRFAEDARSLDGASNPVKQTRLQVFWGEAEAPWL